MLMSKGPQESEDIFTIWNQTVAKFFDEIEKSTSRYQQSLTKLQQEYLKAWKSVINSAILLEKEYAVKTGLRVELPERNLEGARDITEQAIKAYAAQNEIALETTEATNRAFHTFNENTELFTSLNRQIIESMMSLLQPKPKT